MSASEQTSKRGIDHELETAANVYAHDHGSPVAAYASELHKAFMAGASVMSRISERHSAREAEQQQPDTLEEYRHMVSVAVFDKKIDVTCQRCGSHNVISLPIPIGQPYELSKRIEKQFNTIRSLQSRVSAMKACKERRGVLNKKFTILDETPTTATNKTEFGQPDELAKAQQRIKYLEERFELEPSKSYDLGFQAGADEAQQRVKELEAELDRYKLKHKQDGERLKELSNEIMSEWGDDVGCGDVVEWILRHYDLKRRHENTL